MRARSTECNTCVISYDIVVDNVLLLRASEAWARQQSCSAFASDRDDRMIVHRRYQRMI